MLMPYLVLVVKGFFNGWQSKSRRTRGSCTVIFPTADRKFEIPVSYDCLLSTTTMRLLSDKQVDYCTTKDYETQQSSKYGSIISRIPYALDYTCSMGKRLIIIKHVTTISVDSSESGSGVRSKPPLSPWTRSLDQASGRHFPAHFQCQIPRLVCFTWKPFENYFSPAYFVLHCSCLFTADIKRKGVTQFAL